ncbi:hypothetical protein [Azospirillum sp.]|uniref:hypothetical protein n=1 Tax=Azospirillum sp. TaxID=34012 RepID=UPI002D623D32|nr:hypothetical protein [Azospirillum sp.]HYD69278.1 hypothetical protein [Azospirillum sp.]
MLCRDTAVDRLLARLAREEEKAPTRALAQAAGYHLEHTGGGCVVWERELTDGTVLWIFTEGASVDAGADDVAWMVRRQSLGDDGSLVEVSEALTFAAALDLANQLPSPVEEDREV